PYIALDAEIADPGWLARLIVVPPAPPRRQPTTVLAGTGYTRAGHSPADWYSDHHTWRDVLEPHGWTCLDADGDTDGARWLHPTHTSSCSATTCNGCLFVYSTNTPFEPTTAGNPNGYTKFRAYAVLNFDDDLSAAARSLLRSA
ncbi:MAG: bifunctional DNA primase/polymerase, partial [Mycobacterium sp.]